ncbi:hypothetical protein A5765_17055 [Mycolicibacterium celeriflavum]|uniref:Uncharacterized protein n=1 Tax=Mycolicibacterium celeriflavum TaxID=1249101 RepID=A0A7I7RLZ6_MYCCF|nr:hypothetical protein A5765_17055 [Mycolicibacterium celeriflavum]BBY44875.1 hypothetical protein MCEL_31700 [Mycolicibacterium celeriflavum]
MILLMLASDPPAFFGGLHPLVEHAHHINEIIAGNSVVQRLRTDRIPAVARAYLIGRRPISGLSTIRSIARWISRRYLSA